jgi:tight adherence protein B
VGVILGLMSGTGLFCVWWSFWVPGRSKAGAEESSGQAVAARWRELLVQADLPSVTPQALALTSAGLGLTVFLGVLAFCSVTAIAICFAVIAAWLPISMVIGRARRRRERWRELWPEVVDNLASGVRAGLSLPEALGQIGERGPEPLRPPFAAFARDYRLTGNFGEALDALKDRLADPVADRLCEALRITREVGGSDLGRLLRNLSAFLREDARTRSELEARQSWTVYAARLAVAAPWLVLAMLATRPESVAAYDRPAGTVVLLIGAVASLVAYRLMLMIGRLPTERRVLR